MSSNSHPESLGFNLEGFNSGACLSCVRKHLCQAMIIHEEEVPLGYYGDKKRVIGHLAEASRHALYKSNQLADFLRGVRKQIEDVPKDVYLPNYARIIDFVEILIACERQDLPSPDMPAGLDKPYNETLAPTLNSV